MLLQSQNDREDALKVHAAPVPCSESMSLQLNIIRVVVCTVCASHVTVQ